jgi:hypothetical protein
MACMIKAFVTWLATLAGDLDPTDPVKNTCERNVSIPDRFKDARRRLERMGYVITMADPNWRPVSIETLITTG